MHHHALFTGCVVATLAFVACSKSSSTSSQHKPTVGPVLASGTVGASGGHVETADHRVSVDVPAGALANDVALTINVLESAPAGALGAAYEIGPTGTQFAQPVSLVITYSDAELNGADPTTLAIGTIENDAWSAIEGAVSPAQHQVAAQLTHLSPYAAVPVGANVCGCDSTCYPAACSAAGLATLVVAPPNCLCRGAVSDLSGMWKAESTYQSCAKKSFFGAACTACKKRCIRDHGGWIGVSNDRVCQWGTSSALYPADPNVPIIDGCIRSCSDKPEVCVSEPGLEDAGLPPSPCTAAAPCTIRFQDSTNAGVNFDAKDMDVELGVRRVLIANVYDAKGNRIPQEFPLVWSTARSDVLSISPELPYDPTILDITAMKMDDTTVTASLDNAGTATITVHVLCPLGSSVCVQCSNQTNKVCAQRAANAGESVYCRPSATASSVDYAYAGTAHCGSGTTVWGCYDPMWPNCGSGNYSCCGPSSCVTVSPPLYTTGMDCSP